MLNLPPRYARHCGEAGFRHPSLPLGSHSAVLGSHRNTQPSLSGPRSSDQAGSTHIPSRGGVDPSTKACWALGVGGGQGGVQAQNGQRAEKPPKEKRGVWRVTRWSVCTTLAGWPLLAGLRPGSLKYVCGVAQFLSEKQGVY